jgi:hypothetical protein
MTDSLDNTETPGCPVPVLQGCRVSIAFGHLLKEARCKLKSGARKNGRCLISGQEVAKLKRCHLQQPKEFKLHKVLEVKVLYRNVPGGIRTPNLLIRSQKLYPVELQAHLESN